MRLSEETLCPYTHDRRTIRGMLPDLLDVLSIAVVLELLPGLLELRVFVVELREERREGLRGLEAIVRDEVDVARRDGFVQRVCGVVEGGHARSFGVDDEFVDGAALLRWAHACGMVRRSESERFVERSQKGAARCGEKRRCRRSHRALFSSCFVVYSGEVKTSETEHPSWHAGEVGW